MSKNKKRAAPSKPRAGRVARRRRAGKAKAAAVVALAVCVTAGAATAGLRWGPARRAFGLAPAEPLAQATPTPLQLSKEYVYAGGRLVATEEPSPAGPPPTNLLATTSSVAAPSATVTVTWGAPASGTPTSYVVERREAGGQFTQVGQPVAAPSTTFNDTTASEGSAYLYRVKAAFTGGGSSDYSNTDLATAVAFTDDPLVGANDPQNRPATTIKATHLTELRRAVSAVHLLAGLGAVTSWTYPDPVSSPPSQRRAIYLEDVKDLRDRLAEALPALGMSPPSYLDSTLTRNVTKVKKEHFQQLRDAVR